MSSRRRRVRVLFIPFFSFLLSLFFFPFFVLLYSINISNCYSIKCNKHQEKYDNRFSREKIVHRILNIWINNLNFYHFLQFTVGKPKLITIWSFSKQRSYDFFCRLIVIITFQHANWTHSMSFSILLISTECSTALLSFRYPSIYTRRGQTTPQIGLQSVL